MAERVAIQNIRKNSYKHIKVDPIAGALGAEIRGVDLSKPVSDEVFAEIKAAFLENLVVFFVGQDLNVQQQLDFARRWGSLTKHPYLKTMDQFPEVLQLKREADQDEQVIGRRWHSDSSFLASPPLGSTLFCKDAPPYGGDTMFCNLYLAYNMLSPGMQRMLDSLIMMHSASQYAAPTTKVSGAGLTVMSSKEAANEMEHPLVRVHPETGKKSLWITGLDYCKHLKDMSLEDSQTLMKSLQEHVTQELLTCRYRWRKGDMALWDNRCTQHLALDDYFGFRREMYRVEIGGDQPFGPAKPKHQQQAA